MFSRAKVVSMVIGALFALVAGPVAAQQDAAQKAVEAAKQYSGTTITEIYEAALQALLPINYQGPEWERLTGIKVHVIELPYEDLFSKTLLEHRGGTGAYDVLNVIPALLPDLARAGALEPLDPYIEKYGVASEFDDINPVFRNWMTFNGKTYGLVDDGDILLVYYRKDLFADPANQSEFKAQYGYDLAAPTDWKQFAEICHFLTAKYAP